MASRALRRSSARTGSVPSPPGRRRLLTHCPSATPSQTAFLGQARVECAAGWSERAAPRFFQNPASPTDHTMPTSFSRSTLHAFSVPALNARRCSLTQVPSA
ncbi:hypothetical protein SBADM41S_11289 [Streptomyces badius]